MLPLKLRVGRVIARMREAQGYTQETFGEKINVHRTYMGKVERGQRDLQLGTLEKIAKGLGVKLSILMAEAEKERG